MAFETLDASTLASIDTALTAADAGDRSTALQIANDLSIGLNSQLGSDDRIELFRRIGAKVEAWRLSFYRETDLGALATIASIVALASTDIAAAHRAYLAFAPRLTSQMDRIRLAEQMTAAGQGQ